MNAAGGGADSTRGHTVDAAAVMLYLLGLLGLLTVAALANGEVGRIFGVLFSVSDTVLELQKSPGSQICTIP
ncbi:hypothetical protein BIFGAL_03912 [Bifidobacterium gallicum DSM 20093 = LMG 11596]|uniref:Uncharacterized protein n=1 Tax=Bifidobacterium gallicum DSM 20093 = LMG 11596 TaxID=561180 RepID=D1NVM2_9BIFI|nr:hypothetical protein BIFGAL_03912 [Bifidobacterium gallicum DSM 20093 = LMG 11596]